MGYKEVKFYSQTGDRGQSVMKLCQINVSIAHILLVAVR